MLQTLITFFLLIAITNVSAQKGTCDCPDGYDYCDLPYDSATLKRTSEFFVCDKTYKSINGIYLNKGSFAVQLPTGKTLYFVSEPVSSYEVVSANHQLQVSASVNTFDYRNSVFSNTSSGPIKAIKYYVDTLGGVDTTFIFPYKKITEADTKNILTRFHNDLINLNTDAAFMFNFYGHFSQLFLAALNGNTEARVLVANYEKTVGNNPKGVIMRPPLSLSDNVLVGSNYILKMQQTLGKSKARLK